MANSAKTASIPPHDPEWKIVRLAGEWLKRLWWNGVDGCVGQDRPPMAGSATDRQRSFPPKTAPLARKALTDNNSGGYDSDATVTKLTINC